MASVDVEYRCFVGGLAWATTDQALMEALWRDYRNEGPSRGFGFVTFNKEKSMRDAIANMNGQNLDGRNITVNEAQSRGCGGYNRGGGFGGNDRRDGGGGRGGGFNRGNDGGGYGGGRDRNYGDDGSRYSRGGGASDGNWRN
ncbi:hypothetical protein K2173_021421 [Erythroxylum novogranatense]|uniref:RRM domain-containing protein n=1 Tax=Erythroxylum novogranatense TaxID=1862640 RepID=A0AAV8TY08_9ROSI|nr:hypothetical protein K2173_021421 [Erythroxylum novogranatense]